MDRRTRVSSSKKASWPVKPEYLNYLVDCDRTNSDRTNRTKYHPTQAIVQRTGNVKLTERAVGTAWSSLTAAIMN